MKRVVMLLLCVGTVFLGVTWPPLAATEADDGGPWLDTIDGILVLHVEGTPYEMGLQHGTLLKDRALQDMRALQRFGEWQNYTMDKLLATWETVRPFLPQATLDELQGMADAANLSVDWVGAVHLVPSFVHCSSFAAFGTATTDGKLYHARSLDFPMVIRDPVSGTRIQDNAVLIVREPAGGHASLSPSFAGLVGSLGGINDEGIATGVLSCWSTDETQEGVPMLFRQQLVLDLAASGDEALAILNANRTEGWNFIISDGVENVSYAVEQTASRLYVGTWDDPVESIRPFFPIESVVRRTNIFLDPETAETQRALYNPRILPLLSYLAGSGKLAWSVVPAFLPWAHYKGLSSLLQASWGTLNLTESMTVIRETYNGSADPVFALAVRLHLYTALHQWAACPQTGEFLLCQASGTTNAWMEPVHAFSLPDLLRHQH